MITVPEKLQAKKFPHFMERKRKDSYYSTSILGMIYDTVNSYTLEDSPPEEVHQLPCFIEEVPAACLEKWKSHYEKYREEMHNVLLSTDKEYKDTAIKKIFWKYKQELYEASEFEESTKNREDIFNEALSIYQVCYNYAKRKGIRKCGFAWKVAGHALCSLYLIKQNDISFPCSLSVLREVIG